MPAEERHLLHALVRAAREDGRIVRVCGLPRGGRAERRAIWAELADAGVDVIADEDHRGLARYLRRHPVPRPDPAPSAPSAKRRDPRRPAASMVNTR
jgi:hypothetical protein